ncbi:MAG: DUF134 domain-containing protein [Candidatus Bathyarchaeia archaeon]
MWQGRHRCGRRGRLPKPITLRTIPPITVFTPNPPRNPEPVMIDYAELEAHRLVDMEGLSQEEAGQKMNISRGTIWRLVQSARKKTAQALSEGRPIYIVTTKPTVDTQNKQNPKE